MARLLISIVVVQLAILLALRPLVMWYFGFRRMIEHLAAIDESLRTLPSVERYDSVFDHTPPRAA